MGKVFKANRNEDEPKFGAGSEFGKDEARRKKFGIISRRYNPEDQPWLLQEEGPGGRKYKGVKEGGVTENTSYYIFQQAGSGAFEAFPIESWYGFTPTIKYNYLKEEDAEEEFSKRNKVMSRFSTMVRKRINDDKEDDDNDDDDEGSGKKQGRDKAGGKNKKKKNQFNLTDMDDWVEESEEEGSGDSDGEGKKKKEEEDEFTVKKKPKKGEPPKKKKKKGEEESDEEQSEGEESDDGDFEGREEDYITDSSEGESEQEEKAADAMKGVDQEDEDDEEESEDEEKKKKKEEEEKEKGKKAASSKDKTDGAGGGEKEETFESSSSDDSDSDSDVEKDSLLFLKKKEKKKNSSNESSRAPTPSGEAGEGSSKKRKSETDADSSAVKKVKNLVASKTNSPETSSGSSQSPPSSVISAAEKEGLTEDAVRKYLTRKPLTTIDLLAKFKNKKSAMTQEQLVQVMAYYLRRISPVNRKINGKIFWSLSKDGVGEG